jgi:beta-xylosidase
MLKKFGIWITLTFLVACGSSPQAGVPATATAIQNPPALSTLPPLESEPTNTPLPMTINSLLREDFAISPLNNNWTWYSNNEGEIVLSEGWLMLETSNYDMLGLGGNAPVLVHSLFPGDLIIQTHLHFEPQRDYQSAGIAFFTDYDHFVSLTRGYCSEAPNCNGDGIYLEDDQQYILGEPYNNNLGNLPEEGELYLRLLRIDRTYTGYYSTDGVNWIEVASTTVEFDPTYIAIIAAANGAGYPTQMSFFDFVEILPSWMIEEAIN